MYNNIYIHIYIYIYYIYIYIYIRWKGWNAVYKLDAMVPGQIFIYLEDWVICRFTYLYKWFELIYITSDTL